MKTLIELLQELKLATLVGEDQAYINYLAVEVVNRLYVPNSKKTYEEMLNQYGYKELDYKKFYKKRFEKKD